MMVTTYFWGMLESDTPDDPYLEIRDLAEHLGVKVPSVRRYISRGDLPAPDHRVGRSPLWRKSTITAWESTRLGQGWRKGQTG